MVKPVQNLTNGESGIFSRTHQLQLVFKTKRREGFVDSFHKLVHVDLRLLHSDDVHVERLVLQIRVTRLACANARQPARQVVTVRDGGVP